MSDLDFGATIRGFAPNQKVFSRYVLKKILGRGGMGVVWLARDEELERDVALKFLPEIVALDKESLTELKRETRRNLELTHPHIVRVHDFVQSPGSAAISMEYVAGSSLSALKVEQPGNVFTLAQLEPWVEQLCAALDYAHRDAKIVHRDLKPANLMIDAQGRIKVTDFGIARSVSDSVSRVSKQAGGSSGTPVYMSPQQMMGEDPAVSDDIYSLGATLYELLTGKPPFHTGNIMMQVQNKVPPPVNERRTAGDSTHTPVPAAWEQTIAACLAKDPAERPATAREVSQRMLGTMSSSATQGAATQPRNPAAVVSPKKSAPVEAVAQTKISTPRNWKPIFIALAAIVVLLGGIGYYVKVYAPEQERLAVVRAAEAQKLKLAQEQADAATRAQAEQEQKEFSTITAKIDALLDNSSAEARRSTETAVKLYVATAPAKYRAEAESRWNKRSAGWDTARSAAARGGLRLRTVPDGAEVQVGSLALEKSPVTMKEVRLGKYPVVVKAEGYEDWRGEVEVKENEFADPGVITLVRSTGILKVTSVPAGLDVTIDGTKATTPVEMKAVPTGNHAVIFQRSGWPDVRQNFTIARNETHQAQADFTGGSVEITSTPANAEVWAKGVRLGVTPLTLQDQPPGPMDLELHLKGYGTARRTVDFVPGRRAEKWSAELKPGGYLNGRPDFLSGPKAMRAKSTSINGKVLSTIESNYEFDKSSRDGMWNQITERVISCSTGYGAEYDYTEGTTFQYLRTSGSGWTGRTVSGGWANGKYSSWKNDKYLYPFLALVWVMQGEFWPTRDVEEGGTWPVPISGRADFLGNVDQVKGVMIGQLKKLTDDVAMIEYTFTLKGHNVNANTMVDYKGTMQIRVNLAGKYVDWGSAHFQGAIGDNHFENTNESEVLSVTPTPSASTSPAPASTTATPTFTFGGVTPNKVSGFLTSYALEQVDQKPIARVQAAPVNPVEMKRAGITGEVEVEFVVTSSGDVTQAHVMRSSQREFEAPALQAVQQWKFKPGQKDGKPVNVRMSAPITFGPN